MDDTVLVGDPQVLLALLWCGFIVLLAAIFSGMSNIELAEETDNWASAPARSPDPSDEPSFDAPQACTEAIGRYMDAPIFASIFIDNAEYVFDHVLPPRAAWSPAAGERCVAPGIVYVRPARA